MAIGDSNTGIPYKWQMYLEGNTVNTAYGIANAVFNAILSLLTASRIWWITRQACRIMGSATSKKYNNIVAVILESGIIYPAVIIASTLVTFLVDPLHTGLVTIDFPLFITQAAVSYAIHPEITSTHFLEQGIAPTLIIVRAALGKNVESVQQMVTTIQFRQGQSESDEASSQIQTIDLRGQDDFHSKADDAGARV
ncbi:hypothetical protein V5O48_008674 [Marasmius crinis-equi]|uniref:Uncharacterized protein n=1 Tax=Marasmius crinis-equi TaxID=585013 RepID=A0ABR3FD93_9AGAR